MADTLVLGGHEFQSRFILGSGKYNLKLIKAAVEQGGAQIITLALRRANTQEKENILDFIPEGVKLTLAVMGLMASLLSRGDRDVARRLSDFYAEGFDHPESFGKSLEKAKVYAGNLAARDRILNTISSVIIADSRIGDAVRQKYHEVALALGGTVEDADEQMERSINRYL